MAKYPESEINENCLTDIACPHCGHRSWFKVEMKSLFFLLDSGTDSYEDTEWGKDSYCECTECGKSGNVSDFTFDGLEDLLEEVRQETADKE